MTNDLSIAITCPSCKRKIAKTLRWLESHPQMTCTCGQVFNVDPSGFRSARKSIDQFTKAIGRLTKKR